MRLAIATLTYVYADSMVVLGPLATYAEPHSYDLCDRHSASLTVPRGWEFLRLADLAPPAQDDEDDLLAVARAVMRSPSQSQARSVPPPPERAESTPARAGLPRRHLSVVPSHEPEHGADA